MEGNTMDKNKLRMLNEINSAIIQFRGNYSAWCKAHGIGYNEMLVMYSIREKGYCTQKQICDQYLFPRQTINHVINALRAQGILREQASLAPGREKAFVLTERGESYMGPFLASMNAMEARAVLRMGSEKLAELTDLMEQYSQALRKAMEETRETGDGHGETPRF